MANNVKSKNNKIHEKKAVQRKSSYVKYLAITLILIVIIAVVIVLGKQGKLSFLKEKNETKTGQNLTQQTSLAATVNNEPIYLSELNEQFDALPAMYKQFVTKEQVLNTMITEKLVLQEAIKNNVQANSEEVDAAFNAYIASNNITQDELKILLAQQNISFDNFQKTFKDEYIIQKFLNSTLLKDSEVPDKEAEDYYNDFLKPGQIRASHILVNSSELAERLYNDLKKGANFEELAKNYSIDPSVSFNNGDLGFFGKGSMIKEFEEAAFALKVGEISKPVKTQYGWHIILLVDVKPVNQTFLEIKAELKAAMLKNKQNELIKTYLSELISKSKIMVYYNESKEMPAEVSGDESGAEMVPIEEVISEPTTSEEPGKIETQPSKQATEQKGFIGCLNEKVTLYGAYWNKDTQDQLDLLGITNDQINYVECGVQDDYKKQTKECQDAKIEGYPSWKIDSKIEFGKLTKERLSTLTGCVVE